MRVRSKAKRVLISGAGVAGPALAWWLAKFGFKPSIVEIAPHFRTGGYVIDFWGKGYDLVERMGLRPAETVGYRVREVRFVNQDGVRIGGFSTDPFWTATDGRFTSIARGELAQIIWNALPESVATRFGDEIAEISDNGADVTVKFASGDRDRFDLVIGADGLHSRVRELLFGPEEQFETYLGYDFAAFTVDGYEPRTPDVYTMYGLPGRQMARFAMRHDRTLILMIWAADGASRVPHGISDQKALLRERFSEAGWESGAMLQALDQAGDLYVDRMSQIHLPNWSTGRIALVGDAAWAPSFLAGEGTGLGIIGAYVLAGELARSGGNPDGFAVYERRLRQFIEGKQRMATRMGGAFVPKTPVGVWLRNHLVSLLNIAPIARLGLATTLTDKLDLPDYQQPTATN